MPRAAAHSREVSPEIIDVLADSGMSLTPYRCAKQLQPASGGQSIYAIAATATQPAWLSYMWSCGSAGCAVGFRLVYSRSEADQISC